MLTQTILATMVRYSHDVNIELVDLCARLSPEQWDAPNANGLGSLHETAFHIVAVEEEWYELCRTGIPQFGLRDVGQFGDAAAVQSLCEETFARIDPFLAAATDEDLGEAITAMLPHGRVTAWPRWRMLVHAFTHSSIHRGEMATLLSGFGQSPGSIDFYGYGA